MNRKQRRASRLPIFGRYEVSGSEIAAKKFDSAGINHFAKMGFEQMLADLGASAVDWSNTPFWWSEFKVVSGDEIEEVIVTITFNDRSVFVSLVEEWCKETQEFFDSTPYKQTTAFN